MNYQLCQKKSHQTVIDEEPKSLVCDEFRKELGSHLTDGDEVITEFKKHKSHIRAWGEKKYLSDEFVSLKQDQREKHQITETYTHDVQNEGFPNVKDFYNHKKALPHVITCSVQCVQGDRYNLVDCVHIRVEDVGL